MTFKFFNKRTEKEDIFSNRIKNLNDNFKYYSGYKWESICYSLNNIYKKLNYGFDYYEFNSFGTVVYDSEYDYYKLAKNLLDVIGNPKLYKDIEEVEYFWKYDNHTFSSKKDDKQLDIQELENGDLLITIYYKKNKDSKTEIKFPKRIKCGNWYSKTTEKRVFDSKLIASDLATINDAKTMCNSYEEVMGFTYKERIANIPTGVVKLEGNETVTGSKNFKVNIIK